MIWWSTILSLILDSEVIILGFGFWTGQLVLKWYSGVCRTNSRICSETLCNLTWIPGFVHWKEIWRYFHLKEWWWCFSKCDFWLLSDESLFFVLQIGGIYWLKWCGFCDITLDKCLHCRCLRSQSHFLVRLVRLVNAQLLAWVKLDFTLHLLLFDVHFLRFYARWCKIISE